MALAGHLLVSPVIRSKYGNKRCASTLVGRSFQSQLERNRGEVNHLRELAGEIRNLRYQVKFSLDVKGVHITNYYADFVYEQRERKGGRKWVEIVEDTKGVRTDLYVLKYRLMLAVHGIEIQEVYAKPKRGRRA